MKPEQTENLYVETLLRRSVDNGKIPFSEEFIVNKLTGDASTRRYYRVKAQQENYVVCLDHPQDEAESKFTDVQKILSENNCRVPKIYDQRLKKGYLLEEDLGDETYLRVVSRSSSHHQVLECYQKALDLMMRIHSIDVEKYPQSCVNSYCFDQRKYLEEVNLTHQNFLEGYLGYTIAPSDRELLDQSFAEITHKIAMYPMVLTHRDYHSRNLMFKEKELISIDFQDARPGVPQYDLVSLIEDCYFQLDQQTKETLKSYYWKNFLEKQDFGQSESDFHQVYNLVAIQRIYKAIGSFSYIYQTRSDARYLKYIGLAFENLKRFLSESQYNDLQMLLSRYYYDS